jgi:Leucine-rich repeat (LRR) protein
LVTIRGACSPRLDLSNNKLEYLDNLAHMSRLKRLRANNNCLYSAGLIQLSSLVLLSLAHNRMEMLCGMEYLHNLANLNLSDNLISGTVTSISAYRVVRVSCGSDWPGGLPQADSPSWAS